MFPIANALDEQITISVTVEQLIAWILIGLVAGLLASLFVRQRMSLFGVVALGLIGAVVGGFLIFDVLELTVSDELADGVMIRYVDILVAFVGAIVVLALISPFYWRRT